ncbi:hypothetical protein [Ulvibacter antarcticus]|uniref:hypothetical protein n=1 Tax=Ulvibacter antarcticus TaxID=442714 RepID=UPI001FE53644|nr:hypothetical protein [Ulvibacter antarcticus]
MSILYWTWIEFEIEKKSLVFLFNEKLSDAAPDQPEVSVTFRSDSAFKICEDTVVDNVRKMAKNKSLKFI